MTFGKFSVRNWIAFLLLIPPVFGSAQEIYARVQVLTPTIQSTNKDVFKTLETSLTEFLNNNKWTQESYKPQERVECTFVLNITEQLATDDFRATLQVQYSRPVYKSSYNSPVFNFIDKDVRFKYLEFDRLEFVENQHLSNLTSILAYYVYVILGIDHDTFERNSGQSFYVKAQNIVNNAQNDPIASGWRSFDSNRNRFWLVDNLLNPAFKGMIDCYYDYHRLGLDLMHESGKQKEAKQAVMNAILNLRTVHQKRPNSFLVNLFFDAKSDEIVNIFNGGEPLNLVNLKNTLNLIDAPNSSKYANMGQQ